MTVVNMMVGAATPTGATFVAKVTGGGPVRVAVDETESMASPVFTSSVAVDAQGVAKVAIDGLQPDGPFWWRVEDNGVIDTTVTGQFRTHPPAGAAASFTLAAIGDAGLDPDFPGTDGGELDATRVSNHPVFDIIRERSLAGGWLPPAQLGDLHYYNLGVDFTGSTTNYRRTYDDVLLQPRQHQLYREVGLGSYLWDDHDYDGDNADSTYASKANAASVYRERVPHYPLPDGNAIYHSFQIGRVLFVASDTRYDRSPNSDPDDASKTMLGAAQKTWLAALLGSTSAEALVWLMPTPWLSDFSDAWGSFTTERAELVAMLTDLGWAHRMVMVSADVHALALSSMGGNPYGGFPILHVASIDATPSGAAGEQYDLGFSAGRNRYGTVEVTDLGTHISIRLAGWIGEDLWNSYTRAIAITQPVSAAGALTRTLAGSHRALFDARVVTAYQTGDNPDGTTIPIETGDVRLDGTAEVWGSLALDTAGYQDDGSGRRGGRTMFPRRASDLLAPFGHEIFVRRGVDLGPGVEPLWFPLGYFRIDTIEQDNPPDGQLRIAAPDRMAGIVDSKLTEPRTFAPTRTFASVFDELIQEIYPAAVVVFDDASGSEQTGRQLVAEQSRHAPLLELANSLGKILYVDGSGFFRVETAPAPEDIAWEVTAGRSGVLVSAGRSVTRENVPNGFVATGEGGDQTSATRALRVDTNPNSPTFWGGPFGRIPEFYSSPLITNPGRAGIVAAEMLRRRLGLPYNVSFGSVVNPSLRPYTPIRITYRDGGRELHIMETVTIPLAAGRPMSGTTREQTLVQIGVG